MDSVDWGPALAFLLAGLVVGAIMMWRVYAAGRKADATARDAALTRRDLEARRDVLLSQLRELEDTATKRTPAQLAIERYALEIEAAGVLRELGGSLPASASAKLAKTEAAPSPEAASSDAGARPPSALRGFAWGAGSVAVMGLLLYFVSQSAAPRGEGESPTGGGPAGGMASSETAPDPELRRMLAAADADPEDLGARVALARAYLEREDMMSVWNETRYVLERQPEHPEALSLQALVRLAMGQPDVAEAMLQQSIAADPEQRDAYLHLALVYYRLGRVEEGEAIVIGLRERFPDQRDVLDRIQASLEQQAGAGVASGDPHADFVPDGAASSGPPAAAPAAAAPAVGAGRIVGTLELAPGLQGAMMPGVVFLIVRDAGVAAGPPVAVKRLVANGFPLAFELSSEDSMMGAELPEHVRLEVRLDGDGDAMSRDPSDPQAVIDDVALGGEALRVVLSR